MRKRGVILANAFEDIKEFFLKIIKGFIGREGYPFILNFSPYDFDDIEFWRIGWQKFNVKSSVFPCFYILHKFLTAMNRRIINEHNSVANFFDEVVRSKYTSHSAGLSFKGSTRGFQHPPKL